MDKLGYQNYKALNGSIQPEGKEKEIDQALTLHPYKDHRYLYKTRQYLHQTKLTQLREHKQMLEDSITEINKIIGSDSGSVRQAREDIFQWCIVKEAQRIYFNGVGSNRILTRDNKAINKYLSLVNKWLKEKDNFRKSLKSYLQRENYMYQVIHPIDGHKNIINAEVPSKITGLKENRAYIVNQRFGELEISGVEDTDNEENSNERINFIVPLYGKIEAFRRFIKTFEETCLKTGENVSLMLTFFKTGRNDVDFKEVKQTINHLKQRYPSHELHLLALIGQFQRAVALQKASAEFSNNTLLFLLDIDISIEQGLLYRIRKNTQQGKQVYFPIMFSQYDPEIVKALQSSKETCQVNVTGMFANNKGYWWIFDHEQVTLYKSDLDNAGGFNTDIKGCGKEDSDFAEKLIQKQLTIFRSTDIGLIHIDHQIKCDGRLPIDQYIMCEGKRLATYGSFHALS